MANNCNYTIHAVSKNKEALERLIKIMNYEDNEYFIYRCFYCCNDEITKENDFYTVEIYGDVAWAADKWFSGEEDEKILHIKEYEKDNLTGMQDLTKPVYGTAHYITLDILCGKLGIGIELFSEESGCCFQEHIACNYKGNIMFCDSVEWEQIWCDENGNELVEPEEKGGYGDDYCNFACPAEIYYGDDK